MSKISDIATKILDILDKAEFTLEKVNWVIDYLQKYGYLVAEETFTLEDFVNAVREFQEFFNLVTDGDLGPKTLRAMTYKRCSVPDKFRGRGKWGGRSDEPQAIRKWNRRDLTYRITDYVGDEFSREEQDHVIQAAFDAWSRHANIRARTTNGNRPNIVISVGRGRNQNFDGSSGTLAWAYLPDGRDSQLLMRFDMDEHWIESDSRNRGIILFNVACHEIGHLLGLDHSSKQGALMAPYYSPRVPVPQRNDDIPRIQSLYGRATEPQPEPEPEPETDLRIKVYGSIDDIEIEGYRIDKIGSLNKINHIKDKYGIKD